MATPRHIKREVLVSLMESIRASEKQALGYLRTVLDTVERLSDGGTKIADGNDVHAALCELGTSRINRVLGTLERAGYIGYKNGREQSHLTGWILTP